MSSGEFIGRSRCHQSSTKSRPWRDVILLPGHESSNRAGTVRYSRSSERPSEIEIAPPRPPGGRTAWGRAPEASASGSVDESSLAQTDSIVPGLHRNERRAPSLLVAFPTGEHPAHLREAKIPVELELKPDGPSMTDELWSRTRTGSIEARRCDPRAEDPRFFARLPTLGFVRRGVVEIEGEGGWLSADVTRVALLRGGVGYRARPRGCHRVFCVVTVGLSPRGLRELRSGLGVDEEALRGSFSERVVLRSPSVHRRLHLLIAAVRRSPETGSQRIDEEIVQLASEVVSESLRARATPGTGRSLVRDTRLALGEDLADRPSLDELAARAGCSRSHLCRVFKAETGLTIGEYLHRLRLNQAVLRLEAGAGDLSGLAVSLGYSSHSHFTSRFRRFFGTTPSGFREEIEAAGAPSEVH